MGDGIAYFVDGSVLRNLEHHEEQTRVVPSIRSSINAGSFLGFYKGLIESAGRFGCQDVSQNVDCRVAGMSSGWHMVSNANKTDIADAPQGDQAFSILRWFFRVGAIELAFGSRNLTEVLFNMFQCGRFFKLACNDDHGVVRLVVPPVKSAQLGKRDTFDIAPVPNRRFAIVVPVECDGCHPLAEDATRAIFASFEFVADDCHFRSKIFALDIAVHHAIGFEPNRKFKIVAFCR